MDNNFGSIVMNILLTVLLGVSIYYTHIDHVMQAAACANRPITLNGG